MTATAVIALVVTALSIYTDTVGARGAVRAMDAVYTDSPPIIDGSLDDACWANANVVTDFTNYRTESLATEQTFVRVLYDNEMLYVAFECIEPEPEKIVGVERKYDQSLREEDRVEVRLDTFHDHRCAYIFAVNTLATRFDGRIGLFDYDDTWGCDWTAACTVIEDRWFAEIAIPISNLLFDRTDDATWGACFYRSERGEQESSYWCFRNSQARYPQEYGEIRGLDLSAVQVNRKPAFESYVSSSTDMLNRSNDFATGLDMSMRLSPELTSAFTLYPDFGQVEADPDTIELRDTERFLRERRTFFREGSELFDSPINIYYSRRLADIDGGGKVTGQGKNWAMGVIDVQGEIERSDKFYPGNYHVGRMIYNVGESAHIGGIWANSSRNDGTNTTGGVDTRIYLDSTTAWTTQFLGLRDSLGVNSEDVNDHDAYGFYTALSGGVQPLWWQIDFRDISRGFKPDLGYVPRRDIRGPGSFLRYRQMTDDGPLKWVSLMSEADIYENNDHDMTIRDFVESVGICMRNEIEFWYTRADRYHDPYQNWYDRFKIEYNEEVDIWDSISGGFGRGVYEAEPYNEYFLEKPIRVNDRLVSTFEGTYRTKEPREPGRRAISRRLRAEDVFELVEEVFGERVRFVAADIGELF